MPEETLQEPSAEGATPERAASGSGAASVAGGIFSSRLAGLVRTVAEAHFLGVSALADVYAAAFKVPNLLQTLLGEGTLSASFIPIYSRMLDEGREEAAGRFAGAVFGLLLAAAGGAALLGILLAEPLTLLLTPGFAIDTAAVPVDRFRLTVRAVRILFPATALLVLSAWALGVLNSHRRFFLPYFAPVLWNAAIIGGFVVTALIVAGDPLGLGVLETSDNTLQRRLLFGALFGALVGGALQFAVQLPLVGKVLRGFRFSLSRRVEGVREALRAFGPVVAGRGVYQLSAYVDLVLASFLAAGALGALRYAQILYLLPVSLFGLSVAASELPELSRLTGEEKRAFIGRIDRSMRQMLFLTIPTVIGYFAFGFLLVAALFQRGAFGWDDTWLVYFVLGGYSLGLAATAASRLLQNTFYALGDTKTPAWIAGVRVAVSTAVAAPLMLILDHYALPAVLGFEGDASPLFFGAVGLAVGATAGAWVELWRLLHSLRQKEVTVALPWRRMLQMTGLALAAAAPAGILWTVLPDWHPIPTALLVIGLYALVYLGTVRLFDFPELDAWTRRLRR